MKSIGKHISEIRKQKKMTQQELSKLAGVDYSTLRKVETGKTKNPSTEFIEKVAKAFDIPISSLILKDKEKSRKISVKDIADNLNLSADDITEGKLNITNNNFPFNSLTPDQFEALVFIILEYDRDYIEIQHWGGRGDKQRDVLAKQIINSKKSKKWTLFQAKHYDVKNIIPSKLKTELDGIKKYFFDDKNPATEIENIVFCLSCGITSGAKEEIVKYAKSLDLPEPNFWAKVEMETKCKMYPDIIDIFFTGYSYEIKKGIDDINKKTDQLTDDVGGIGSSIRNIERTLSVGISGDEEMQRARRLINEGKYSDAKAILLRIEFAIESSKDGEKRKKFYNNLGLCYTKSFNKDEVEKGIDFLYQALDIDSQFEAPKQNLIATYINEGKKDKDDEILRYAQEIYEGDRGNLDYLGTYLHVLHITKNFDDAKSLIADIERLEEKIVQNEQLCMSLGLIFLFSDDLEKADLYVSKGLTAFPESVNLNNLKGMIFLSQIEKEPKKLRNCDIIPFFPESSLKLAKEALDFFNKALALAQELRWPEINKNQIRIGIKNCLAILYQARYKHSEDYYQQLVEIDKDIRGDLLSPEQKNQSFILNIWRTLTQERNFNQAYRLYLDDTYKNIYSYEKTKDIALKFFQNGSPEYAIKILISLQDESREKEDFEYWKLLTMSYALNGDKSSALRIINEAKSFFASKDRDLYKEALSNEGALSARYRDNSESDRLVKSIFEQQKMCPDEKILIPMKAIEDDGSLSPEAKEFFKNTQDEYAQKRKSFQENPMPIYWLQKMFHRSFPEALEIPQAGYDFDFTLPYNALDEGFIEYQQKNFYENDIFVIDYSALLNFARADQLGLFQALGKRVIASEYLLFTVQADLLSCENEALRSAWNFLRSGDVELFPYQDFKKKSFLSKSEDMFDEWLMQEIEYCIEKKIVLLTDDLRLLSFVKAKEISGKAINSFVFFQNALQLGKLEKMDYSRVLGELADMFYHFIPFNGEDLLNIISDDSNRIRNGSVSWANFKVNPDLKVSRKVFHLLNQVNLPGSNIESFLVVCFDFLIKLFKLGFTEDDKLNWTVFITNFFGKFISEENLLTRQDLVDKHVSFIVKIWKLPVEFLPQNSKDKIFSSFCKIENLAIRHSIEKLYQNLGEKDLKNKK